MGAIDQRCQSLQTGLAIAERYRLVERLGTGGMGAVWRATHVTLAHDVAIKFLQVPEMGRDARARFEREARLAARLGEASRHITRVIDYGVLGTTPYLVMELLQGETLSQRLRRERRLPLPLAAKMIAQLCRALQVAHGAGVIHRDLKPSNIFLARSELHDEVVVKLMDFGVAKITDVSEDEETTGAGTIIGTPGYMSPEQIMCKRLDARTDLWGVGATLYRLLCGRSPFGQGSIAELGLRIVAVDPLPPTTLNPALPKAIDAWMEKALAKSAEERFQTARDLADALALVAGTRNDDSEPVVGAIVPLPDETLPPDRISVTRDEPPTRIESPGGRRPRVAIPLVGLVALAVAGLVVARMRVHVDAAPAAQIAPLATVSAPTLQLPPVPYAVVPPPPPVTAQPSSAPPVATVTAKPKSSGKPSAKPSAAPSATTTEEGKVLWDRRDEL